MTLSNYIDVGDRVIVLDHIREPEHLRTPQPDAAGKAGVVESNDGWGMCRVRLDDGSLCYAWNGCDLRRSVESPSTERAFGDPDTLDEQRTQ